MGGTLRGDVPDADDPEIRALVELMLLGMIVKDIEPKDCAPIEEALAIIAPLPVENVAAMGPLLLATVGIAALCPAP